MKEQEAIERCKSIVRVNKDFLKGNKQTINQEEIDCIETVLNMLKEKDVEIKEYKRMIAAGIINAAKDELVQEKNKEIEKKDKQINYMANFINDNTPYTKDTKELENEEGIRTAEFTTKYFERKSEE